MSARIVYHPDSSGLRWHCPGCGHTHMVNKAGDSVRWDWNGDLERPTLRPSVLVVSGHFVPGHDGKACWCTYNKEHPDEPAPFKCERCHCYITDGRIQFLGDCTHALAGQTVDMLEVD